MRHLPRSRSCCFRAVWILAALAWIMPASGALAGTARMLDASAWAQSVQSQAPASHCDGSAMTRTAPPPRGHAPEMPMAGGNCCHGDCHCVSACNAVLSVPRLIMAGPSVHAAFPIVAPADPASAPSAPPLRPPIA